MIITLWENLGKFDSIFWEVNSPSSSGTATANGYYDDVWGGGNKSKACVVALFVSTVRPSATWSPDRAATGTCWYTNLQYHDYSTVPSSYSHNVSLNFNYTGKVYVGFGVTSSILDWWSTVNFNKLSISFF